MAIRILSSENITGNLTLHNPSNAPYIDFVENSDTSDSKARITMDQIDTNNGTLLFATENAGTLTTAFSINKTQDVRTYAKLGIRVDGDAIPWRGTAQIPAVINLAGNGAVFTRPDVTYLSQNFYYNASDIGAVIDAGKGSLIELTAGELKFSNTTSGAANGAISVVERMRIDSSGDLSFRASGQAFQLYYTEARDFITNNNATAIIKQIDNDATNARIDFTSWTDSVIMTIKNSGNVGIGTTTPTATLDVHAPSTTAPSLAMGAAAGQIFKNEDSELAFGLQNQGPYNVWMQSRFDGNVSRPLLINPLGGNIGIGTTSPDYILTTQGSGVQRLKVVATNPSQHSAGVYFLVKNGATQVATGTIATQNNGDMDFYTGSSSEAFRMTILAGGNVGIGVTSPSAKLHVNGSSKLGGGPLYVSSDSSFSSNFTYTFRDGVGINNPNSMSAAPNAGYTMCIGRSNSGGVSGSLSAVGTIRASAFTVNINTTAGIGGSNGDVNAAEIGPGYINLSRDDTAAAEQIRFEKNGVLHSYIKTNADALIIGNNALAINPPAGKYGFMQHGISNICSSGYVAGNATLSFDYDCTSMSSMFVECVMNHYGYIASYGCSRIATMAVGPVIQIQNIQEITSGNGGSWTFNRVSNTRFNISKTAGTYAGGGYYMINIRGNGLKYT